MTKRIVITEKKHPQDIPDQFYYSSPQKFGGGAAVGDEVVIEQLDTHAILARGVIVKEGKPYEECRTVQVVQRYC